MRTAAAVFLLNCFCCGCSVKPSAIAPTMTPPPEVASTDLAAAARADTAFALDVYGKLPPEGNLVFSPAGLSIPLEMAWAGARGATAEAMEKTLHMSLEADRVHAVNHKRIYDWNGSDGAARSFELSVACSLWGQTWTPVETAFLSLMQSRYGATFKQVDFAGSPGQAASVINEWVQNGTRNKIAQIVQPADFTKLTRLMLVNAVYFKGDWDHKFEKEETKDSRFYRGTEQKSIAMMHQQYVFPYSENKLFQAVEIPYRDKTCSMLVLLPRERTGLDAVTRELTPDRLSLLIQKAPHRKIDLFLPRFKLASQHEFSDSLQSLGMGIAFDRDRADFTGMTKDVFIKSVVQKAALETSEDGSEAATATYVHIEGKSEAPAPSEPIPVFRADHPFLFLIYDKKTEGMLFMGRVDDPAKE